MGRVRLRATHGDRSREAQRRFTGTLLPPGAVWDQATGTYTVPGAPGNNEISTVWVGWYPTYDTGDAGLGAWNNFGAAENIDKTPVFEFAWRTGTGGVSGRELYVDAANRSHCVRMSDRPAWEALMPPFAGAQFWGPEKFPDGPMELADDAAGLTGFPLASIKIPLTQPYEFWAQASLGTLGPNARINLWIGTGGLVNGALEAQPIAWTHRMTPAAFTIASTGAGAVDELVAQGAPAEAMLLYGFSTALVKGDVLFLYASADQSLAAYGSAQLILKTLS